MQGSFRKILVGVIASAAFTVPAMAEVKIGVVDYARLFDESPQAKTLKDVVTTCGKIVPVARDLAAVTGGAELQADAQAAEKLYDRARQVLDFDYANGGRDTSKSQGDPGRDRERIR